MNITDIDDKIILHTRFKLLVDQYKLDHSNNPSKVSTDLESAWLEFIQSKFCLSKDSWSSFINSKTLPPNDDPKYPMFIKIATNSRSALDSTTDPASLIESCRDILSLYLDKRFGDTITDEKPFRDFARFYEDDFFTDMDALNVLLINLD